MEVVLYIFVLNGSKFGNMGNKRAYILKFGIKVSVGNWGWDTEFDSKLLNLNLGLGEW